MSLDKYREEVRKSLFGMVTEHDMNIDENLDLTVNSLAGILIGLGPEKVGSAISAMDPVKFNEFAKKIDGKGIGMITDQISLSSGGQPAANPNEPQNDAGQAPSEPPMGAEASPAPEQSNEPTGAPAEPDVSNNLLKDL